MMRADMPGKHSDVCADSLVQDQMNHNVHLLNTSVHAELQLLNLQMHYLISLNIAPGSFGSCSMLAPLSNML